MAAVAQLEAADRARQRSAEHFSDTIARVAGTPWFAWLHVAWFAAWVAWNAAFVPGWHPIDPFPFSFLTLVVSLEAIFLSIFVLISQNNLTRLSERRAHLDLQRVATTALNRTPEWTSNVPDRRHWTIPSAAPERRLDQIAGPDPTVVHREPPATALAGARGLPDVERQDRRLHEDRPRSGGVKRPLKP